MTLNGPKAYIEDKTATGSNSALTALNTLASNADLFLQSGASVSTTSGTNLTIAASSPYVSAGLYADRWEVGDRECGWRTDVGKVGRQAVGRHDLKK